MYINRNNKIIFLKYNVYFSDPAFRVTLININTVFFFLLKFFLLVKLSFSLFDLKNIIFQHPIFICFDMYDKYEISPCTYYICGPNPLADICSGCFWNQNVHPINFIIFSFGLVCQCHTSTNINLETAYCQII